MKISFVLILNFLIISASLFASENKIPSHIERLITYGEFTVAQQQIRLELALNPNMPAAQRLALQFEIERLERIKKDFTANQVEILTAIQAYIPEATLADLEKWEAEKSLECRMIDGEKKYFKWAANNLFRINQQAKARKIAIEKKKSTTALQVPLFKREHHLAEIIQSAGSAQSKYLNPQRFRITYLLTVNPDVVLPGKVIRCWLPFPREKAGYQINIKLIATEPDQYILADNQNFLQRTIYLEKVTQENQPTQFKIIFEYTGYARYKKIEPLNVLPGKNDPNLAPYLSERPPHIVFTTELRELTQKIVGPETNPYLKAKKIFEWISKNIPWASAREYSTIRNISSYCYNNLHGDCGIQTILFMTLARIAGIPTKWQSGWTTEPGSEGMHDWGEMYLEPYGWVPVDASYGLRQSQEQTIRWFYLGNLDRYRLVVNDDYSQYLYPAKIFPRSETVDFQRGEVEWEGGNLYFDLWEWQFEVEYLE